MVGLFITTLPVRVTVSPNEPVLLLLQRLFAQQARARQYQHVPLASVQGWSGMPAGVPLFDSILVFENYPADAWLHRRAAAGLEVTDVRGFVRNNFALTMAVIPGQDLLLRAIYDPRRFDDEAIERVQRQYAALLETIAAQPTVLPRSLSLLTSDERREVLARSQRAPRRCDESTVLTRFEAQVARRPADVAVVSGATRLSYGALDRQATALARNLRAPRHWTRSTRRHLSRTIDGHDCRRPRRVEGRWGVRADRSGDARRSGLDDHRGRRRVDRPDAAFARGAPRGRTRRARVPGR